MICISVSLAQIKRMNIHYVVKLTVADLMRVDNNEHATASVGDS